MSDWPGSRCAFPESIFSYYAETAWYKSNTGQYGIPLDTRHTLTKSDWQIITAAFVTDTSVRNNMISAVLKYASNGQNNVPFGDLYDTTNGKATSFKARPAVGGHLALLSYSFSGQNTASSPKSGSSSIIVKPGVVLVTMSSLFSIMSSPWYI